MRRTPPGYLTIAEAAAELDMTPWDVKELIEADMLKHLTYVNATAVAQYAQAASA